MAMTPAQLQEVIAAVTAGLQREPADPPAANPPRLENRKIDFPTISEVSSSAFRTFRSAFENAMNMAPAPEDQERARRFLRGRFEKDASDLVDDVALNTAGQTWQQLMDIFQDRFVNPANSKLARTEFATMEQGRDETILVFHGRCRTAFRNAYPEIAAWNGSALLIDTFLGGLYDREVSTAAADQNPQTFNQALQEAMRIKANRLVAAAKNKKQSKSASFIGAIGDSKGNKNDGKNGNGDEREPCPLCKLKNHELRSCFHFINLQKRLRFQNRRGRGNFRRGTNSFRGRGRRSNDAMKKSIANLDAKEDDSNNECNELEQFERAIDKISKEYGEDN